MMGAWWQYLLPQHTLSWVLGRLASSRSPWCKDRLIRAFARHYQVDMTDAACEDLAAYASFNAFFTRPLRAGCRPVAAGPSVLASPADGALSQFGDLRQGRLLQAKGRDYSAAELLDDAALGEVFAAGSYATVYLAPRDYHRVHMPAAGQLRCAKYLPGTLFSVNAKTAEHVPRLLARNERMVAVFDTDDGALAVVMVGAMIVVGIHAVWPLAQDDIELRLARGEEMGHFSLGSTVVVLSERPLAWREGLSPGVALRMGQALGDWPPG